MTVTSDLQQLARDHLWMHFTRMGGYGEGETCRSSSRATGATSGRERQALPRRARRAVLRQHRLRLRRGDRPGRARADARAAVLHQLVVRAPAGDRARGRARLARAGRPQPRLLRLGRLGGGRVGVEARAAVLPRRAARSRSGTRLARARDPTTTRSSQASRRGRAATRRSRGTSPTTARRMGALSINGIPAMPDAVRAAPPRGAARPQHEPLPPARRRDRGRSSRSSCSTTSSRTILAMGPETVCLVHMEPVQNAGGCFTAAGGLLAGRARRSATSYDILLSADEVITGFGRLGDWFGSERYDIRPDIITSAKGLSSSYGADRRGDRDRPRDGAVPRRDRRCTRTAITFGGHPGDVRDRAEEHRDHEAREDRRARPRQRRTCFRDKLETLLDLPIVGDVRGDGLLLRASSSSRTRRRGRRSTTTSASRCCAASSPRRCSTRA